MSSDYGAIPASAAAVTVEVRSPASLSEGFVFESIYEGNSFQVTVPEGGVTKGQVIHVPVPPELVGVIGGPRPPSSWKYGLCDCCQFDPCHPSFLLACCCAPFLWAQVMTRMGLTWLAERGTPSQVARTFAYVSLGYMGYLLLNLLFGYSQVFHVDVEKEGKVSVVSVSQQNAFGTVLGVVVGLFLLYIFTKTRIAVRARYNIPRERCGEFEDCCCVLCCGCCTVSQVAKETADYTVTKHGWFTNDGLAPVTPVLTV